MVRPVRLSSWGVHSSSWPSALPAGGGATPVFRDTQTFAPGAQVAAANWTDMPNLTTTSAPPGSDAVDNAVSCVNADFCMAVGAPAALTLPPFAEFWNGATWAELPLPPVNGQTGPKVQLAGVSCVTTQFCIAVGNVVSSGVESPLIAQWDGSAWTVVQDSGTDTTHSTMSPASRSISAWRWARSASAPVSVFVEQWNGTTWAPTTLTNPETTIDALGTGISCTTTTFCMIVGAAGTTQSGGAYAASWDGTTWTPTTTANSFKDVILAFRVLRGSVALQGRRHRRTGRERIRSSTRGTEPVGHKTRSRPFRRWAGSSGSAASAPRRAPRLESSSRPGVPPKHWSSPGTAWPGVNHPIPPTRRARPRPTSPTWLASRIGPASRSGRSRPATAIFCPSMPRLPSPGRATAPWPPMAGSSASARRSSDRSAGPGSTRRSSAWRHRRRAMAITSWRPTAAIFGFGNAPFFGSMGGSDSEPARSWAWP